MKVVRFSFGQTLLRWTILFFFGAALPTLCLAASEIHEIPVSAEILSGDGLVAAGDWPNGLPGTWGASYTGFSWSIGRGSTVLPSSDEGRYRPFAISEDGSAIVGAMYSMGPGSFDAYVVSPFRWTLTGGLQFLGSVDMLYGEPRGISADGGAAVGMEGLRGPNPWGGIFVWRQATGIISIGIPFGLSNTVCILNEAIISGDGQTIVVGANYEGEQTLYRWTEAMGYERLGLGIPIDISTDGSIVVGVTEGGEAFRHTDATGIEIIGDFTPYAANADGSIIVGGDVIWSEAAGIQSIEDHLASHDIDLAADGWVINSVSDISDDGYVLIGSGINENGVIIDNGDYGFGSGPSEWPTSNYGSGAYGTNYQYQLAGTGDQWATWAFDLQYSGDYEIFAQWPAWPNRATDAPYTIEHPNAFFGPPVTHVVNIDQRENGGRFNSLGLYEIRNPSSIDESRDPFVSVTLTDTPSGVVVADAIKVVYQNKSWMAVIDPTCTPPASLTVPSTDDDGTYTIRWGASGTSNITYVLEEAVDGDFSTGLKEIYRGTDRSVDITERSAGTFFYRVKTIREGYTDSDWVASGGCTVSLICSAPTTLTVPSTDDDGVYTISWGESSTGGVTYVLQEATNSDFSTGLRNIYSGTDRSVDITGRNDATYYYRVKTNRNGYTDSSWLTSGGCTVVLSPEVCSPPASLAVPSTDDDGTYTISWGESSTGGATYVLQEATSSDFTSGLQTAYSGDNLSVEITGKSDGTYYYRIKATKSGLGDSEWRIEGSTSVSIESDGDGRAAGDSSGGGGGGCFIMMITE